MLEEGLVSAAEKHGISLQVNRIKGALSTHFTSEPVSNYEDAQKSDGDLFSQFFHLMLDQGIVLAPSKYEAWFITIAHTEEDIQTTIEAVEKSFAKMASVG